jgi:hypothetical protein
VLLRRYITDTYKCPHSQFLSSFCSSTTSFECLKITYLPAVVPDSLYTRHNATIQKNGYIQEKVKIQNAHEARRYLRQSTYPAINAGPLPSRELNVTAPEHPSPLRRGTTAYNQYQTRRREKHGDPRNTLNAARRNPLRSRLIARLCTSPFPPTLPYFLPLTPFPLANNTQGPQSSARPRIRILPRPHTRRRHEASERFTQTTLRSQGGA